MTAAIDQSIDEDVALIAEKISILSPRQKTDLLVEIAQQLRDDSHKSKSGQRSIKELRGLGKEIWEGIDAQEYVNAERDSWDG